MTETHPLIRNIRRFMPLITAVCTLIIGGFLIPQTAIGSTGDTWSHVYRISSFVNEKTTMPHPVIAQSPLYSGDSTVGGKVDWSWIQFSMQNNQTNDPSVAIPQSLAIQDHTGADIAFNSAAKNNLVSYVPQIAGFAVGKALNLAPASTYRLAQSMTLLLYALCMALAVSLLPRWRIVGGILMLNPLALFPNAFEVSPMAYTQAVAILFCCLLTRSVLQVLSMRATVGLSITGFMLCLGNLIALPVALLVIMAVWVQTQLRSESQEKGILQKIANPRTGEVKVGAYVDKGDTSSTRVRLIKMDTATNKRCSIILWIGAFCSTVWTIVWLSVTNWFPPAPGLVPSETWHHRLFGFILSPSVIPTAVSHVFYAIFHGQTYQADIFNQIMISLLWIFVGIITALLIFITFYHRAIRTITRWCWWLYGASLLTIFAVYFSQWAQYTSDDFTGVYGIQYSMFIPVCAVLSAVALICVSSLIKQPQLSQETTSGAKSEDTVN